MIPSEVNKALEDALILALEHVRLHSETRDEYVEDRDSINRALAWLEQQEVEPCQTQPK